MKLRNISRYDKTHKSYSLEPEAADRTYSHLRTLRKQKRSNPRFEAIVESLSLEELIAVKMELTSKSMNHFFFGIPVWKVINLIVKEAVILWAASSAPTKRSAAAALGINLNIFALFLHRAAANPNPFFNLERMKKKLEERGEATKPRKEKSAQKKQKGELLND